MSFVRIHHFELYVHSHRAARRLINDIVEDVKILARVRAARGAYSHGDLADSIESEILELPDGYGARVGSRLPYAASVEAGAEIHDIFPRGIRWYRFGYYGGPALKFYWRKVGRTVLTAQVPMSDAKIGVSHPGQKGKHFLRGSVVDVARHYRMHVIR